MEATLDFMPNAKNRTADRHKPSRMVRIPERIAATLEQIGAGREMSLAEMVKAACLDFLEKSGNWPPPSGKRKS